MIYIGVTCYDRSPATINLLQVAALENTSHGHFVTFANGEHLRLSDESYDFLITAMGNLNDIVEILIPYERIKSDGKEQQDTVD